jgi:hypothetical protein
LDEKSALRQFSGSLVGKFAKQYMKEGYEMSLAELERWSELTLSTDFEDAEAHALPK